MTIKPKFKESDFKLIPPHDATTNRALNFPGFQAPAKYMRIIELLYSEAKIPWQTYSDVMRAFVDAGCERFAAAIGGSVATGTYYSLRMMNKLVDQAREANDFAQSIDQLDREVQRMVDGGMRESAVGLVYSYREQAKGLEDRILRRKLVADINQRFAFLLTKKQGRKENEKVHARIGAVDPEIHEEELGESAD